MLMGNPTCWVEKPPKNTIFLQIKGITTEQKWSCQKSNLIFLLWSLSLTYKLHLIGLRGTKLLSGNQRQDIQIRYGLNLMSWCLAGIIKCKAVGGQQTISILFDSEIHISMLITIQNVQYTAVNFSMHDSWVVGTYFVRRPFIW